MSAGAAEDRWKTFHFYHQRWESLSSRARTASPRPHARTKRNDFPFKGLAGADALPLNSDFQKKWLFDQQNDCWVKKTTLFVQTHVFWIQNNVVCYPERFYFVRKGRGRRKCYSVFFVTVFWNPKSPHMYQNCPKWYKMDCNSLKSTHIPPQPPPPPTTDCTINETLIVLGFP